MLQPVAELRDHRLRQVARVLRDEIHAHPLRADQAHHLLDLLQQRRRRVRKQQVCLVEEEHEPRLLRIADLGQLLEQFRQQPQQEGRVELRRIDQLAPVENVHIAAPVRRRAHQVGQLQRRLAEESLRPVPLQHQQLALHRRQRRRRHVAILAADLGAQRIVAEADQQLAQVFQVQQQQPVIVGILERDVQHALLHIRQPHQARQEQGPHLGNRRADRMPRLAEHVPEDRRRALVGQLAHADLLRARHQVRMRLVRLAAGHADAREVAFHIGGEHRHAGIGKGLRHDLQRHRLAGTGRPRHDPVTVGHFQDQRLGRIGMAGAVGIRAAQENRVTHPPSFILNF